MRNGIGTGRAWPWLAFLCLLGVTFCLSLNLVHGFPAGSRSEGSISTLLLGQSRSALADSLYDEADTYFHKGVPESTRRAFTNDWFQAMRAEICPSAHTHAEGRGVEEIMPWLRFATLVDPKKIEPWLVAAFWLASEAHRPDLAEKVLDQAQYHNPRNFEIQMEKGRLFLRGRRPEKAAEAFDAGLRLWPSDQDPACDAARLGREAMLLYRGLLWESDGKTVEAARLYRDILAMYPNRSNLQERVSAIEAGKTPAVPASTVWMSALKAEQSTSATRCERAPHGDAPSGKSPHGG
jgi:tetratricopeptide (TPR) repeat protein